MRFLSLVAVLFFTPQAHATPVADLLFKDSKSTIPVAEKDAIARLTGLTIASDGTSFMDADFPASAQTREMDLNGDQKPEILLILSGPAYGMVGSSVQLFIKNAQGQYVQNLGFPAADVKALSTKTQGYQDLEILGPGFECPVWKWNGKEYAHSHQVKCGQ